MEHLARCSTLLLSPSKAFWATLLAWVSPAALQSAVHTTLKLLPLTRERQLATKAGPAPSHLQSRCPIRPTRSQRSVARDMLLAFALPPARKVFKVFLPKHGCSLQILSLWLVANHQPPKPLEKCKACWMSLISWALLSLPGFLSGCFARSAFCRACLSCTAPKISTRCFREIQSMHH